jgi:hypothetical protein
MNNLTLDIQGFAAVNRDLVVELRDPISNTLVKQAKPFLDGTTQISQVPPGSYEITVLHPNLTLPVLRRPIRVLPVGDTRVTVLIDPSKFRNMPIEDIPDANLDPVRARADSVAETVLPLGSKMPGEAIRADDWNTVVSSLRDLALAVSELTRLVTPVGHNHPELEKKIDEITQNFDSLVTTLSAAMAELQRQIQAGRLHQQVSDVLDAAGVADASRRKEIFDTVGELEQSTTTDPSTFARKAREVGVVLATQLDKIKEDKASDPAFLASDAVKAADQTVDVLRGTRTSTYASEIENNRKADRLAGGGGLLTLIGR